MLKCYINTFLTSFQILPKTSVSAHVVEGHTDVIIPLRSQDKQGPIIQSESYKITYQPTNPEKIHYSRQSMLSVPTCHEFVNLSTTKDRGFLTCSKEQRT